LAPDLGSVSADADVLMNLLATNCAVEMLKDLGMVFIVSPAVASESIYLESADVSGERDLVDLLTLEEAGVLERTNLGDNDVELLIELVQQVDDGEAQAIAIAEERGLPLATDDRKARLVAEERGNVLLSTPEVLQLRQVTANVSDSRVSSILRLIERRSHYRPPADHRLYDWWMRLLLQTDLGQTGAGSPAPS
jgi:predicted nucleic acid-binding protein